MGFVSDRLTVPFANQEVGDYSAGMPHDNAACQPHDLHSLSDQVPLDRLVQMGDKDGLKGIGDRRSHCASDN
ncbi:hypothetical protein GCM10023208_21180 [Erythrobacter westpacificensis]|uniref:Uncharacterized protein n=1 Tax=Erythrobacter westpacificensis TaxID=1055231 RepID=A0ABP9KD44_9SPHN